MQNALKSNEWRKIFVHKTIKIEIQKRGPNNSDFLQNCFHREIRSPFFNLTKFRKSYKSSSESYWMHWYLMNDEGFSSLKVLKVYYRRRDQIIQSFCRIDSPPKKKLGAQSLIRRNSKSLRKVPLNQAGCIGS